MLLFWGTDVEAEGKKCEQADNKKEGSSEKKISMKTLSKTVSKLSPKAQRRKDKSPSNVAKLKVRKCSFNAGKSICNIRNACLTNG